VLLPLLLLLRGWWLEGEGGRWGVREEEGGCDPQRDPTCTVDKQCAKWRGKQKQGVSE